MSRMEEWRLLNIEVPELAAMNLAIDEAVFVAKIEGAVPTTLRFWRNKGAVVLGRFQNVAAEVDLDLCRERGIQVVRRFSGGGAVYHDLGNLNYSIAIEKTHPLLNGLDIVGTFRVFSFGVTEGLRKFGLETVFDPPSDLLVGDKKVSGNAQSRRKGIIFHHGTLLVHADLDMLTRALNAPEEKAKTENNGVSSRKRPVMNVWDAIGRRIGIDQVKEALQQGFEKAFGMKLVQSMLTLKEKETAERLYANKYSKGEWNFWR